MPLHSLRVHDDLARFVSQVDVSWSADGDTLDSRTLVAETGIDLLISVERALLTRLGERAAATRGRIEAGRLADQPHLVRDFTRFSGASPSRRSAEPLVHPAPPPF